MTRNTYIAETAARIIAVEYAETIPPDELRSAITVAKLLATELERQNVAPWKDEPTTKEQV